MTTSYSARRILSKRIALKQTRTLCVWQTEMLPMNKHADHPGPSKSSEYASGINIVGPEPSSDTLITESQHSGLEQAKTEKSISCYKAKTRSINIYSVRYFF